MTTQENVVDLTEITEEDLQKLRERNVQKFTALGQNGGSLDTFSVLSKRLDVLIELIFDKQSRIKFEYAFETEMSNGLDNALAELRTARITQGVGQAVQQNPKLILPGA